MPTKPTAGYPTQKAAILALLDEGVAPADIAERLGCTIKRVHDVTWISSSRSREVDAPELSDAEGAQRLKQRIEAYWKERGFNNIEVELHPAGFLSSMRTARVDLRSNLVNGQPPEKANRKRIQRQAVAS